MLLYGQVGRGIGMRSVFLVSLFLIMLLIGNNVFVTGMNTNNVLMAGIGTNDFGLAIISVLAAILIRNTNDKK